MAFNPVIFIFIGFISIQNLVVGASTIPHPDARQVANPNGPIAGWTPVGCFTDRGAARTLMAASIIGNATMTPAVCTEFCASLDKGFAGVENGQDCWCDGVIQLSANQTAATNCNIPCAGDSTLLCGGPSIIEIFTDGTPSPALLTRIVDQKDLTLWSYIGCYADSPRVLEKVTGSITSQEDCINLCAIQEAISEGTQFFTFAGIENEDECWCGSTVNSTLQSQRLLDMACAATACTGDTSQACGGPLVMTLYQQPTKNEEANNFFNSECRSVASPGPQIPSNFTLTAVFKDTPTSSMPINLAVLDTTTTMAGGTEVLALIISACPTCDLPPLRFNGVGEGDGFLRLFAVVEPGVDLTGGFEIDLCPGGTLNMIQITAPYLTFGMGGYCFVLNPLDSSSETLALSAEVVNMFPTVLSPTQNTIVLDMFAPFTLCANNSASGRLDVVYTGIQDQLGFNLTDCRDIVLTVQAN